MTGGAEAPGRPANRCPRCGLVRAARTPAEATNAAVLCRCTGAGEREAAERRAAARSLEARLERLGALFERLERDR